MFGKTGTKGRQLLILLIGLYLCSANASPVYAAITIEYGAFPLDKYDCTPLSDPDACTIVQTATQYWNTITKNSVNMTITYGQYTDPDWLIGGISYRSKGKEVIGFNMANDFSYTVPGQKITGTKVDFFSLTAHEIAHNMGIELDPFKDPNRIYPREGSKWVDLIRDKEGNSVSGLWISPGPDPTKAETFADKVKRGGQ